MFQYISNGNNLQGAKSERSIKNVQRNTTIARLRRVFLMKSQSITIRKE
nr:MAG TPA: hypothetical protein [Caudoviricetes sp.]